jgi:BirA family biotin operon repressor/biotin-[acetyl-CoA-carboxylase] ligase
MRPGGSPAEAALRSFVAALGLHDALATLTGAPGRFSLKWPNDVLLDGRKLAGILLETHAARGAPLALAIGVGVNLVGAPEPASLEPGALAPVALAPATGCAAGPEALLDALAPAVARWEARLAQGGFAPIRAAWLDRAARIGDAMVARTPSRTLEGRFETIDASGALVLATEAGRVTLPAAEVHFAEAGDATAHAARH